MLGPRRVDKAPSLTKLLQRFSEDDWVDYAESKQEPDVHAVGKCLRVCTEVVAYFKTLQCWLELGTPPNEILEN
jgi:hypothetical protein